MFARQIRKMSAAVLCAAMPLAACAAASSDGIEKDVVTDSTNPSLAEEVVSADSITKIDLFDCYAELYDSDGNIAPLPGGSLSEHDIPSGYTMRYYQADTSQFYIEKGQYVSVIAQQDDSHNYSWRCGYGDVALGEANSQAISGSGSCNAAGSYFFYITNRTDHTMHITSGSVEYC